MKRAPKHNRRGIAFAGRREVGVKLPSEKEVRAKFREWAKRKRLPQGRWGRLEFGGGE